MDISEHLPNDSSLSYSLLMQLLTGKNNPYPNNHNISWLFHNTIDALSNRHNTSTSFLAPHTNNYMTNTNAFDLLNDYYNYYDYKNLSRDLWIYLSPCIFLTGVIGNILILIVMTTSQLKGTTTCTFLQSMALADLLTLVSGMVPEWLYYMDLVVLKETHPIACKLEKFLNFTCTDTSIWICVAFTIDRLMAVCFPMLECSICLPRNAKLHVFLAFLAGVFKNLHVLWTRGAEHLLVSPSSTSPLTEAFLKHYNLTASNHSSTLANNQSFYVLVSNCGSPSQEFKYFEEFVRPWLALVLISLLPCSIIISCNVLIVRSLLLMRLNKNKVPSDKEASTVRQMTVLCLTASLCFLVCNTPSIIMLIMKPYWRHTKAYHQSKPFINQIFFINHSINFFLYCITGKRFRQALKKAFSSSSRRYTIPSHVPLFSQTTGRFRKRKVSSFNVPILFTSLQRPKEQRTKI